MGEFRIGIGIAIPAWAPIRREDFPALAYAVRSMVAAAHQQWVEYAQGKAALPNGKTIQSRTGEYARSILVREVSDFSAEIYSDLAYAKGIEEGTPARDMKKILNSSLKVRLTHDGRRYLIIPFRFNNPNSVMGNTLPPSVYKWWSSQTASHITGHGWRKSGTGAVAFQNRTTGSFRQQTGHVLDVRSRTYSWGTKLGKSDLDGLGVTGAAAKRLSGMVMFRRPGKTGNAAHTQFITFRVMTENSKGWIAPAREGMWPARTVADTLRPVAEKSFAEAAAEDIQKLLGGA
jgi:hypothetical protein